MSHGKFALCNIKSDDLHMACSEKINTDQISQNLSNVNQVVE